MNEYRMPGDESADVVRALEEERNAAERQVAELRAAIATLGSRDRPDALEYFRQRLHQALGEHAPQGDRYSTLELIWAVERVVAKQRVVAKLREMPSLSPWVDALQRGTRT